MRINFLSLILIFSFTLVSLSEAQEMKAFEEIEFTAKIVTALRQSQELLYDSPLEDLMSQDKLDPILLAKYEKILKKATISLVRETLHPNFTKSRKEKIIEVLTADIKWKHFAYAFATTSRSLRNLGKRYGTRIIGFAVFTSLLQFTVPVLLSPIIGTVGSVILFNLLGNVPTIFYYKLLTLRSNKLKSIKFFGGEENLNRFKNIFKEAKKALKIDSFEDFIVDLSHPALDIHDIKISDESFVRNTLRPFGFKDNSVNLRNINKFIDENSISSEFITLVRGSKRLNNKRKNVLLILELNKIMTVENATNFHIQFSKYFVDSKYSDHADTFIRWTKKASRAKTARDLMTLFNEVPESVKPVELIYLWDRVVLPQLINKDGIFTINQYNKLLTELPGIHSEIFLNKIQSMDKSARKLFRNYIQSAMEDVPRKCYNSHDQVLRQLVRMNPYLIY